MTGPPGQQAKQVSTRAIATGVLLQTVQRILTLRLTPAALSGCDPAAG